MLTALLALLHAAPALAAGPRLLLVGDTGDDTAMARVVAADLAAAQAGAEAIIALGDLYYDAPPIDAPDCVDQLVARYSAFFRTLDPAKVVPVTGNHDVTTVEQKSFSPAARACTVAAWKKMGWVKDDAPSHVRALQKGGVRVDLAVIDSGFYGEGAPRPSLSFRKQAHWRFYAAHYVCENDPCVPPASATAHAGVVPKSLLIAPTPPCSPPLPPDTAGGLSLGRSRTHAGIWPNG